MKVVDRKPVPIYEVECYECHSKIEYKASEVSLGYITCPVCGTSIYGSRTHPVRMDAPNNAHWIKQLNGEYKCSVCGDTTLAPLYECGTCGTKMDGGENG